MMCICAFPKALKQLVQSTSVTIGNHCLWAWELYKYVCVLGLKPHETHMLGSISCLGLMADNGGGMTPDKMRGCMSLGYFEKRKLANSIGQYGNGFKTSTMRLGADVLVFTRNRGQDFGRPTQSIGMLSYTFLMETGKQDIVVPMRPTKKPKIEVLFSKVFLDPIICDNDKQQQMVVVSPISSTIGENGVRVNYKKKEVASLSLSKQFWKAGDYESCGNNSEMVVPHGGYGFFMGSSLFFAIQTLQVTVGTRAFAKLLNNSLDEVRTIDRRPLMLKVTSSIMRQIRRYNGGGMTLDKMHGCMSLV
ncbi:microrchidia 7-like protein [Tanacetum coccineum]